MAALDAVPREQRVSANPTERRAWVRYGSDLEVACRATGAMKDAGWIGKLQDISQGGLGLLVRHRFRPGTPLLVELRSRNGACTRTVPVHVVHARAVVNEGAPCWLMGCTFASTLTEEELQAFL